MGCLCRGRLAPTFMVSTGSLRDLVQTLHVMDVFHIRPHVLASGLHVVLGVGLLFMCLGEPAVNPGSSRAVMGRMRWREVNNLFIV